MERLQAAARHTGCSNIVNIKFAVIGAVLVRILGDGPFKGQLEAFGVTH